MKIKSLNISIIAFALMISTITNAQIPTGYYNSALGLTGNPLKIALHNIIKNHTQISYNALWTAYKKTDVKSNGKVWDMYSDIPSGTPPYVFTFVTDQCGSYANEGDCYNREHSWPQSWFNSVTGPVSDLFHVYPTDGKVNGLRSNYPYGNVSVPTSTTLNGGKLGPSANLGYSLTVFEPIDDYKGDLARTYFYMSTRYYGEDSGWSTSDATNKATILPWQVNVLLQWHHQDPVSAKEIARNDSVYYKFQNNRNPFIDNPQWADSIWKIDVTVFMKEYQNSNSFSVFPNPTSNQLTIRSQNYNGAAQFNVIVTDISGNIIEEKQMNTLTDLTIDCSLWNNGMYFIDVKNESVSYHYKVIKI